MPRQPPVLSAHATRHPDKPVQPTRKRGQSQASKASRALAAAARSENNAALEERYKELFASREEDIKTLARDYNKPESEIRRVLENGVRYTGKRAVSLKNAITHDLSKTARENDEPSNARDEAINLSGEDYKAYVKNLSEEEKERLLKQLADTKDIKEHGARATNKAAALDAVQTAAQVGKVLIDLHSRTSVRGFAMFTRGDPDDTTMPCWQASGEANQFFDEMFDISVWDLTRKFELWSCNLDKGDGDSNNLDVIRKRLPELLDKGLQRATGKKNIKMAYTNYKIDIVHGFGVELAGWPAKVTLARPSKMPAQDARRVFEKLRSGAIHWVSLTRSQREEVAAEVEEERESGTVKQRKPRNDKNKKRGPRVKKNTAHDDTSDSEGEDEPTVTLGKRKRTSASAPAPTAAAGPAPIAAPVPSAPASTAIGACSEKGRERRVTATVVDKADGVSDEWRGRHRGGR
ncbi:hypothetical protein B0H12DRAFT_1278973 [Mycena haematopus]|nr:hypothetical protein B0H12DRAFT_1278973 [Mycena haematopus]